MLSYLLPLATDTLASDSTGLLQQLSAGLQMPVDASGHTQLGLPQLHPLTIRVDAYQHGIGG